MVFATNTNNFKYKMWYVLCVKTNTPIFYPKVNIFVDQ